MLISLGFRVIGSHGDRLRHSVAADRSRRRGHGRVCAGHVLAGDQAALEAALMRIFVDVGAHYGETLRFALNPKWGFDRVYSFEPSKRCLSVLRRLHDPRLTIIPAALSDRDGTATLYGTGLRGASLYSDKRQMTQADSETIDLIRASDWIKTLPDAEIWLKLNCEGAEADILQDLLDSGEIERIHRVWVHFDIAKVPSQSDRQGEIERRLRFAGVKYHVAGRFGFIEKHWTGEAWLERFCRQVPVPMATRLRYMLPNSPYDGAVSFLKAILPRRIYWWLGHRFGRLTPSRP